jgi:hypothetical protein
MILKTVLPENTFNTWERKDFRSTGKKATVLWNKGKSLFYPTNDLLFWRPGEIELRISMLPLPQFFSQQIKHHSD